VRARAKNFFALAHMPARLREAAFRHATRDRTKPRGGGDDRSRNTGSYAGVANLAALSLVNGEVKIGYAIGRTPGSHPFAIAVRLSPQGKPWRTQCAERTESNDRLHTGHAE
jgi:hypothetical protein